MSRNVVEVDPKRFPWLDLDRYTFSLATEQAGIVYLSGQTASEFDPSTGQVVCRGDLLEQTRVIYEKLGVVLEAAGMSFANVVQTVDYIDPTALPQYRDTGGIRREYLGGSPVASTGICVERLLRPDALLEVSAVAVAGEKTVIDPGWERYGQLTYVPGVECGDTIWLSGFVGNDEAEDRPTYPQDTSRQLDLTYGLVARTLRAAGCGPQDIVKNLEYVSPQAMLGYEDTGEVRREFYQGQYPATTGIPVNRLLRPEGHVEVETVAVRGGAREEIVVEEWSADSAGATQHPGIKKGRMLQLSGQSGVDHRTGSQVGRFDIAAQADQAYANLAQVMATGGYSMNDIVNTIEWVAPNGLSDYRKTGEVRRKYFGKGFPSSTGVVMHRIRRPGPATEPAPELLFEVTAVAIV